MHCIYTLFIFYILFVFTLYTFYIKYIYIIYTFYKICMYFTYILYTFYIHFLYILYTLYIHSIYFVYTLYTTFMQFYASFGHVPDMFRTSFLGRKYFCPKSFGDLWAILWHHRRCLRRGGKILKISFFSKK